MEFDETKIENAVLAMLYLSLHKDHRAWKSLDWEAMNGLHERGLISNPVSKAKSVILTEEGEAQAAVFAQQLFGKD